ncbi:MAG: hypothetical protein CVU56_17460, partial [Deltaproteobacteria bacterium HGW-Deltaproteobacteria-14]
MMMEPSPSLRGCLVAVAVALLGACGRSPEPPDPAQLATRSAAAAHLDRARAALDAGRFAVARVALDAAAELTPRDQEIQRARQRVEVLEAAADPEVVSDEAAARLTYAVEVLSDEPALAAASAVVRARLALLRGEGDAALAELD